MISPQYQFDLHPYSLIQYKNCIFHGQIVHQIKQNTGILLLDNGQVLIGNFQNDQLHGDSIIFINPETYVIGSFTRGMLDGKFTMRTPKMTVYWTVRMNKIQGQIIVISYETMTARTWIIQNGQGTCLKQIDILQTDKESQILSAISPSTSPEGSCVQFICQKFAQTMSIESSALTHTSQICLSTNSINKIKITIFREKLIQYGVYYQNQLNGLGYYADGPNILQGRFLNGKLDGYGIKWQIESQKIIYGSFKNGDIRTIDIITDNQQTARKQLINYKKQQHIYSLEYCNNYFNERPILMLINFLATVQQNDNNFTKELQYQDSLTLRSQQKVKEKISQKTENRFLTPNKLNLSLYSKDKTASKAQTQNNFKKDQPYQSRFKKNDQSQRNNQSYIENNQSTIENSEFNEGINEFNRINKALRKFK